MITLLLAVALAAPPDSEDLADAELDALALIDACRYGMCAARADELAEAFLVRATAAAVLRGEIDATAAANARHLAPDLAVGWGSLLPDSDRGVPDGWVRDWTETPPPTVSVRPVVEPAPVVVREPRPPRPPRAPVAPLELDGKAPAVARVGVSLVPGQGGGALWLAEEHLETDLRVQLSAPVALFAAGSFGATQGPFVAPPDLTDVAVVRGRDASLRLGAGPRWTNVSGHEVFVYAAFVVETGATTWRTWEALAEDDLYADPGGRGLGGTIGVIGARPVSARVALHGQGSFEYLKRRAGQRYLDQRRQEAFDGFGEVAGDPLQRDAAASDLNSLRLGLAAHWRTSAESPILLFAGLDLLVETRSGPRPDGVPRGGFNPDGHLIPRLGASFVF